mmetsp:Transcript_19994/g.31209  ORF Transcript_19994/g.31209 Transcript_19994/m.31209 type:complete len:96 (-) Transcript_19994:530-817(-)
MYENLKVSNSTSIDSPTLLIIYFLATLFEWSAITMASPCRCDPSNTNLIILPHRSVAHNILCTYCSKVNFPIAQNKLSYSSSSRSILSSSSISVG